MYICVGGAVEARAALVPAVLVVRLRRDGRQRPFDTLRRRRHGSLRRPGEQLHGDGGLVERDFVGVLG